MTKKKSKAKATPDVRRNAARHRRKVFAKVKRGVVAIVGREKAPDGTLKQDPIILGTGFWFSPRVVVTARHIFDGWLTKSKGSVYDSNPWVIMFRGVEEGGKLGAAWGGPPVTTMFASSIADIVALRVKKGPEKKWRSSDGIDYEIQPLRIADDGPEEGDEIATCGFPFGLQVHPTFSGSSNATFTRGIVSSVLPYPDARPETKVEFRVNAMFAPGNSGGPVFHVDTGEVVGVVASTHQVVVQLPTGETVAVPTGIGHAVPIYQAREQIQQATKV